MFIIYVCSSLSPAYELYYFGVWASFQACTCACVKCSLQCQRLRALRMKGRKAHTQKKRWHRLHCCQRHRHVTAIEWHRNHNHNHKSEATNRWSKMMHFQYITVHMTQTYIFPNSSILWFETFIKMCETF